MIQGTSIQHKQSKINEGAFNGANQDHHDSKNKPVANHNIPTDNHEDKNNRFNSSEAPMASKKVYCGKHRDKEIEYYCKLCHSIVCPKCMFAEHNGHELAQLEDVTSIIKQNIHDLSKLLMNAKHINEDKRYYIGNLLIISPKTV